VSQLEEEGAGTVTPIRDPRRRRRRSCPRPRRPRFHRRRLRPQLDDDLYSTEEDALNRCVLYVCPPRSTRQSGRWSQRFRPGVDLGYGDSEPRVCERGPRSTSRAVML
jgi:hypothetical protein